jgi:hypothetical protein
MPEESYDATERAKRMGWVPQEEFRGNLDNWADAETFVRLAEESLPIAKGTIKVMEKKMAQQEEALRDQTAAIESMKNDFAEFVQFSKASEQRAYDRAVADLQLKQREAVESGDVAAFDKATAELDATIMTHPAATAAAKKPGTEPASPDGDYPKWMLAEPKVFENWTAENEWFHEEPEMFAYAQQMDQFLMAKHGLKRPRSTHLADIAKAVRKKFPDHFGNPARKAGSPVEGDTGGAPRSDGKRSYHDLPPEAKEKCDKWSGKDGKGTSGTAPGFTREDYLKTYKW